MAGTAAVREASARQTGAVGTTSPEEGIDLAVSLAHLPLPRGRRVAVVTLGGGWGVIAADEVARNGLVLADLPPTSLRNWIRSFRPFGATGTLSTWSPLETRRRSSECWS